MANAAEMEMQHRTVLLEEAVDALLWRDDGIYVDCTLGRCGHSRRILERLGDRGKLIALDKDPQAIEEAKKIIDPRFSIAHESFARLRDVLAGYGVTRVAGVLLDLGVSSPQLDDPTRGFSFRFNGPLDMRMDPTRGESAAEWLARATVQEITEVIKCYGEERFAFQIAKALLARRMDSDRLGPLVTTGELASIVAGVVKTRERGKSPVTRTFQALRIHVNQELVDLQIVLDAAADLLEKKGKLVVISFHSLEDRIVKRVMRTLTSVEAIDRRIPMRAHQFAPPPYKLVGKVKPCAKEIAENSRARSAIMRIVERVAL
ncbi:16S rRNA (cytosine(1402)-N(4))-methyltransferase RsmH [Candidatus Pandoraea novymonadis]|uniref:Ribosomal RNA small subunit methyltransferase H n=1 Tax=Candidatus Pandoraea novymonadis TaxID=1808959 RepID=A0ABX5FFB1_9BURK|nr:16S rRNA (cytosine(1402)-N(4))-methyltransferase RsmH [Candidatus Pandoraea novymonadis]PSB92403.1 Ribosomal RNA small subunit methyltransferase H [Candidatus Pandoraea novymonadis]